MRVNWPTWSATTLKRGRVYVGLSGGVDSAVSAALLKQQGYDVVGAFIRIKLDGYPCSALEDKLDAQRVAAHLKIPFVETDLSDAYRTRVFEMSMAEFEAGRTPNPDALCNREIKFGIFYDWCMKEGADFVATGHYARVATQNSPLRRDIPRSSAESFVSLLAGADANKDQSYFLWAVPQEKLAKTIFPIGGLTKPQVRELAAKFNLPNAGRPDSQGLCFLGDVSIEDMLHKELALVPGDVVNEAGEVVGRHEGVQAYTLGQRHGFTLLASSPNSQPHYVVAKNVERNTITVSPNKFPQNSTETHITLRECNWIGEVKSGRVMARYRYRGKLIDADLDVVAGRVVLAEPEYVPEGQSLVMYDGERCLGGGIIESVWLSLLPSQTALLSPSTSAS